MNKIIEKEANQYEDTISRREEDKDFIHFYNFVWSSNDTHFVTRKFKDHLTKESKHCFTRIHHLLSTTKLENDSILEERVALPLG